MPKTAHHIHATAFERHICSYDRYAIQRDTQGKKCRSNCRCAHAAPTADRGTATTHKAAPIADQRQFALIRRLGNKISIY